MRTQSVAEIVCRAWRAGVAVPGFNIPYLPMMAPVVRALADCDSFGLIMVARLEWVKFQARGLAEIRAEYERVKNLEHTRLHLDHVPVIDEDGRRVEYARIVAEARDLGYDSVMVDGSRLSLADNIRCTREVVELAAEAKLPVEAELGAVLGHEAGPLPDYEELFASRRGFTSPAEAGEFVRRTGVDWLSVAVGNIHGAIGEAARKEQKPRARLDLERLGELDRACGVPLVLHGGSGLPAAQVRDAFKRGIAKLNVATALRQPYEANLARGVPAAQEAVYAAACALLREELQLAGSRQLLTRGVAV